VLYSPDPRLEAEVFINWMPFVRVRGVCLAAGMDDLTYWSRWNGFRLRGWDGRGRNRFSRGRWQRGRWNRLRIARASLCGAAGGYGDPEHCYPHQESQ
jgi:hypothetical protein